MSKCHHTSSGRLFVMEIASSMLYVCELCSYVVASANNILQLLLQWPALILNFVHSTIQLTTILCFLFLNSCVPYATCIDYGLNISIHAGLKLLIFVEKPIVESLLAFFSQLIGPFNCISCCSRCYVQIHFSMQWNAGRSFLSQWTNRKPSLITQQPLYHLGHWFTLFLLQ